MIDIRFAQDLLRRAMETQGPDFVYMPRDHKDGIMNCRYTPQPDRGDHPSAITGCIVGVALDLAGCDFHHGDNRELAGIEELAIVSPSEISAQAALYLSVAQGAQDMGATWGAAVDAADNWVVGFGEVVWKDRPISLAYARDLLHRAVATQGRDFVYITSPRTVTNHSCKYKPYQYEVSGGTAHLTGCLIGVALDLAGETAHHLHDGSVRALHSGEVVKMEDHAMEYFQAAQNAQDRKQSWGEALDAAEAVAADLQAAM